MAESRRRYTTLDAVADAQIQKLLESFTDPFDRTLLEENGYSVRPVFG